MNYLWVDLWPHLLHLESNKSTFHFKLYFCGNLFICYLNVVWNLLYIRYIIWYDRSDFLIIIIIAKCLFVPKIHVMGPIKRKYKEKIRRRPVLSYWLLEDLTREEVDQYHVVHSRPIFHTVEAHFHCCLSLLSLTSPTTSFYLIYFSHASRYPLLWPHLAFCCIKFYHGTLWHHFTFTFMAYLKLNNYFWS